MSQFQPPFSFEELKGFLEQFAMMLPEENREFLQQIIAEIESAGGDPEKLQELMKNMAGMLGLFGNLPGRE